MIINWYIVIELFIVFIGIGLIISKIRTGLSWSLLLKLKYEILILTPILRLIDNSIRRKKVKIGRLYKIKNKLEQKLTL